ncbi:MAG: lysozyme [Rhodospirillaceae bacterium]
MTINQAGLDIIRQSEGLRLKAYLCPAGVWTIGYGHTRDVVPGLTCTEDQANAWLLEDVAEAEQVVADLVDVPLTENQFSALVSFTFNLGRGNLSGSTLLRQLNDGDHDSVPEQLRRWVYSGGKRLGGLVRRRDAEAVLWQKPNA